MALVKIEHYYPDYRDNFKDDDIKKFDVYSDNNEKIGSVHDVLVDENNGNFRYLIVDTGFWVFGKKVLLPVGLCRIDYDQHRVYAVGVTKEQAENLPEFTDDLKLDRDYEDRVRGVYRPTTATTATADIPATNYDTSTYNEAVPATNYDTSTYNETAPATNYATSSYDYDYDRDTHLYGMSDRNYPTLKLYEERLIASKNRAKTGEVVVGKHVETETARVSVPVERERVVIERTTPDNISAVGVNDADFREGEVARVEVYEEQADVRKEAFVREQVNIRKETDIDTVNAEEQIRREELDVDAGNRPIVERTERSSSDRI